MSDFIGFILFVAVLIVLFKIVDQEIPDED